VNNTKGVHVRHTYLKDHFKTLLEHIAQYTAEQNEDEAKRHQNFAVGTYMLLVVGLTIFTDMSKNCVQVFYLEYFRDLLTVSELAWGPAALTHLYKHLSATTTLKVITVTCYMTLFQVTNFI
jgi:hypothetical protein